MENKPLTTGDLAGKTALVTGGTTGIGKASAFSFHAAGARVTLTGVDTDRIESLRRELPERMCALKVDARLPADAARLAEHVRETYDGLDILF